ncbi:hypothetical protein [Candidatus Nitrospira allomarina]|jgi:hypothetical protein|uniref:Uncharacterized protein n=1 Tax=Candidatus Nitrospira allomarina TaxID=3020900 RepID=A0AA96G8W2_9BACT|nr:hypothetical protein [Candidatus Nitrospira allomarina]WNM56942.1 hypothetical protein PP769_13270 [Candidatus Nitrospira allomarina]
MFLKPSLEPGLWLAPGDRPVILGILDGEYLPIVIYRNIQEATYEGVPHV